MIKRILPVLLSVFLFVGSAWAQSAKKFYKQAKDAMEAQELSKAVELYTSAIELDGEYVKAYYERAHAYLQLDKKLEAAKDYKKLAELEPKESEYFFTAGKLFFELNHFESAASILDGCTALDRKNIAAYQMKIWSLQQLSAFAKAVAESDKALEYEETPLLYYYKGLALDSLKRYEEAERNYLFAIGKNASYEEALISLARVQNKQAKYESAIASANRALQLNDKNPQAFWQRSFSYYKKLEYANAINDLSKLSILTPKDESVFWVRGNYYMEFNQTQSAINDFSLYLNHKPESAQAYLKRAQSYEQIMQFRNAIKDYEKFMKLSKDTKGVAETVEKVKKRLYELNREEKKPRLVVIEPKPRSETSINVVETATSFVMTVNIEDESDIKYFKVDGKEYPVKQTDKENTYTVTANIPVGGKESLAVMVSDVYNNIESVTFKIIRTEMDAPEVELLTPYASENGVIYLQTNDSKLYVEGKIKDESLIRSIFIEGAIASFVPDDHNPSFSANVDIRNKTDMVVKVTDIFGNETEKKYLLNRESADEFQKNPMGKTWVLFIENSDYSSFASLEGPSKDVAMMKSALANYKIHNVLHRRNMTKDDMNKLFSIEIRDLVRKNKVNSLVIWYAGHGKFLNETGYWIPVNAKRDEEFSYFNINNLKASLQSYSDLTHTLVISDACESGPSFYQAMRSVDKDPDCGNVANTKFKSSQVLSSAGYEEASDDSKFTRTFAQSLLHTGGACVSIDKIAKNVKKAFKEDGKQEPKFAKIKGLEDENGTFFFIKKE